MHVETCPFEGERIFFENAGGSLRLKSVVETSALYASYPDNQGRENEASKALVRSIENGKSKMRLFFNADRGDVIVGESGTELLFRLIRTAALELPRGGTMLSSTLEHPASMSAMKKWAKNTLRSHIIVEHDDELGTVDEKAYLKKLTRDVRVVSIVHTSPVTGMTVDLEKITKEVRNVTPDCIIIVDGIQHSSHGAIDVQKYNIDGYVVSPYKMFSRHGYGVAWASDRLCALGKEQLVGGPFQNWELGTRDAGSYATFSDVVDYLDWLGSNFTNSESARERLEASSVAIKAHEQELVNLALHGSENLIGLIKIEQIEIIGDLASTSREGVVSFYFKNKPSTLIVEKLRQRKIRVHIRKDDHYCGNILRPLNQKDCIRFSICHYNSKAEVIEFLKAINEISAH
ncbi:MAG: aminotransferase class V-fold PLP-dependent enzyme [Alphaproteobacteria bacterium]|nr:MAG: aminotransferase class V-fold PLP-dependent enzyme [Alphaproteobacteria bacterium]